MTNWGAHSVDMMQYALGMDHTGPIRIMAQQPESIDSVYADWSHKTPAPTSDQERRFWPVRMWYANGVEVHFTGRNTAARF